MTKEEALEMLAILKAAYPNSYNGMSKQEALGVVTVWALQFAAFPADIVFMALQKAISASKFPPSVHEVKKELEAVHWEAYEMLRCNPSMELSDIERKQYQRIYDATHSTRAGMFAPPISQMLKMNAFHAQLETAEQKEIGGYENDV